MPFHEPSGDREHFLKELSSRRFVRNSYFAARGAHRPDEQGSAREGEFGWNKDLEELWGPAKEIMKRDPAFSHEIMSAATRNVGNIVDPLLFTAHRAAKEVNDPKLAKKILEHAYSAIEERFLSELRAWEKAKSEGSPARLWNILSFSDSLHFHAVLRRSVAVKEFLSKHPEIFEDLRKESDHIHSNEYAWLAAHIVAAHPDLVGKLGQNPQFHTFDMYKFAVLLNPDILPDLARILRKLDSHENFSHAETRVKPSEYLKYDLAELFSPWHRVDDPHYNTTYMPDEHIRRLRILSKVPEYYAKGFFKDPAFSDFLSAFVYHHPEIALKLPEDDEKRGELFAAGLAMRLQAHKDVDKTIQLFRKHRGKMYPEHLALVVAGAFDGKLVGESANGQHGVLWEQLLQEVRDRMDAFAASSIMQHILEKGQSHHAHTAFSILAKKPPTALGAISALVKKDPKLAAEVLDEHAHELEPAMFAAAIAHLGRNGDPRMAVALLERHRDVLSPELIDATRRELKELERS